MPLVAFSRLGALASLQQSTDGWTVSLAIRRFEWVNIVDRQWEFLCGMSHLLGMEPPRSFCGFAVVRRGIMTPTKAPKNGTYGVLARLMMPFTLHFYPLKTSKRRIFVPFWAFVLTILILVSQWILHIRKNRKEDESLMLDAATISLTNSQSNAAKKD